VQFLDRSEIHFREYLDEANQVIEKVMYTYHYQDATNKLIFRYDNAAHRPTLSTATHRHDASGTRPSESPDLQGVLAEIAETQHWL
jgi:Family of unknown function (DUF6516)